MFFCLTDCEQTKFAEFQARYLSSQSTEQKTDPNEVDRNSILKYANYVYGLVNALDKNHFAYCCFEERFSKDCSLFNLAYVNDQSLLLLKAFKYITDLLINISTNFHIGTPNISKATLDLMGQSQIENNNFETQIEDSIISEKQQRGPIANRGKFMSFSQTDESQEFGATKEAVPNLKEYESPRFVLTDKHTHNKKVDKNRGASAKNKNEETSNSKGNFADRNLELISKFQELTAKCKQIRRQEVTSQGSSTTIGAHKEEEERIKKTNSIKSLKGILGKDTIVITKETKTPRNPSRKLNKSRAFLLNIFRK